MAWSLSRIGLAFAALLMVALPWPSVPADSTASCADLQFIEGLGPACAHPNGLVEVFGPSGESLGFTHGLDPAPSDQSLGVLSSPQPVSCVSRTLVSSVSNPDPFYIQVIYARAFNDADNFAADLAPLRSLVQEANGLLGDSAAATGGSASLRVRCSGGVIEVQNAVLPTAMASASFATIVSDLRNIGFNDLKVKYWVFYDDTGACSCGGTGTIFADDRPTPANFNNGFGTVPTFAVNFGYLTSARIMLHELGHNLGAVQNSAPHTTLAFHCTDGLDTMCYNDGGPNGASYTTTACSTEVFDCHNNDYFHLCPPTSSYLFTHWNLGSSFNNYITFDQPRVPPSVC